MQRIYWLSDSQEGIPPTESITSWGVPHKLPEISASYSIVRSVFAVLQGHSNNCFIPLRECSSLQFSSYSDVNSTDTSFYIFVVSLYFICYSIWIALPPLCSSGQSSWLQIQRSRVRFPALPDFLRSSGSGTGSTQPREDNWGATWMEK
jgi:hypothetical protein